LSSTILRDPEAARPWPPRSLRSSPTGGATSPDANGGELDAAIGPAACEPEALLQQARMEAAELLRAAQEEAEQLRAAAYEQGQQQAREEIEQERTRLQALSLELASAYQRFCRNQIPALAELATLAAEKLMADQLALEPERALAIVRAAMSQVVGSAEITLRLNPEDVDLVQAGLPAHPSENRPAVQIVADPAVERGGCWIDSEQGKVDATIAGRLARLEAAFEGE